MLKITLILLLVLNLMSCGQKQQKEKKIIVEQKQTTIEIDTSVIAFLPFDTTEYWLFKDVKQSELSINELKVVEKILIDCIEKYNIEQKKDFEELNKNHPEYNFDIKQFVIDLKEYKRQYIAVINNNGEKEVWINCFCKTFTFGTDWRKKEVEVMDGGKCFFNLKINIDKKEYYDFMVNGF